MEWNEPHSRHTQILKCRWVGDSCPLHKARQEISLKYYFFSQLFWGRMPLENALGPLTLICPPCSEMGRFLHITESTQMTNNICASVQFSAKITSLQGVMPRATRANVTDLASSGILQSARSPPPRYAHSARPMRIRALMLLYVRRVSVRS